MSLYPLHVYVYVMQVYFANPMLRMTAHTKSSVDIRQLHTEQLLVHVLLKQIIVDITQGSINFSIWIF